MQTKLSIGAVILSIVLIGGAALCSKGDGGGGSNQDPNAVKTAEKNVVGEAVVENGVQYIDVTARGGYSPRVTKAKAGIPTIIRMETQNSYDCSTALVIPQLSYQKYLPQTGITEIEVSAEEAQGTLRGLCSMAMYQFEIEFE